MKRVQWGCVLRGGSGALECGAAAPLLQAGQLAPPPAPRCAPAAAGKLRPAAQIRFANFPQEGGEFEAPPPNKSAAVAAHSKKGIFLWALALVCGVMVFAAAAEEKSADQLLPASTAVYLELSRPQAILQYLDHPIWQKVQASDRYQQSLQTQQAKDFLGLIAYLEQQLGTDWKTSLRTLTEGGVYLGADAATQGVALLVKSKDPAVLEKLRDAALNLARQIAQGQGQPDPVQTAEYRGITGYQMGPGGFAVFGPWLLVTNKKELAQAVLDRYLDTNQPSLGQEEEFTAARGKAGKELAGWGYVRVKMLRDVGVGRALFAGRSGNPAAELLVGGILGVLGNAPYGTLELRADTEGVKLSALLPHSPERYPAARQFFYAPAGQTSLATPLRPKEMLLSLSAYRDIAAMWKASPELFDPNVATQLAQADSQLSNFFGGRSFSAEILGNIGPRFQFIAARAAFDPAAGPVPAIKLPAMALVMEVKDPQLMQPYMKVAFQTIVGIVNIQSGMAGRPTLLLTSEAKGDATLLSASYLAMTDSKGRTDAPIYHNFSPAMALVGNQVVIASTKPLAEELAGLLQSRQEVQRLGDNTRIELDGPAAVAALRDNRSQLVAQNMIQQGHDKAAAEKEVDLFLEMLGYLRGAEVKLTPEPGLLRLEVGVRMGEK